MIYVRSGTGPASKRITLIERKRITCRVELLFLLSQRPADPSGFVVERTEFEF